MDLVILGVIIKKFFLLSNYKLSIQLLVVNISIIFFGLIFLILFNYYLITNNDSIKNKNIFSKIELKNITNYLQSSAIVRVPLYQTNNRCKYLDKEIDKELFSKENCEEENLNIDNLELSDPLLERFSTEQFIIQNYVDREFNVKIYNDNWIKVADSLDFYPSDIVSEIDLLDNKQQNLNFYNLYKQKYYSYFNTIYNYILKKKFIKKAEKKTHNINIVSETIRKKDSIEKLFFNKNNEIIRVIASPILYNNKVFGVSILTYPLISTNDSLALLSINLLNFFLILIIIIAFLSFFFLRGLIRPLNELTKLTVLEREKIKNNKEYKYPERGDEIGILADQIQIMSKDLKTQMEQLEKFSTDVAHELKNPLTAIKSSSELLLKNKISEENKIIIIKNFNKEVDRMNRLISDISNFSRTISEIEIEDFKLLNLNKFVEKFKTNYLGNIRNINLKLLLDNNNLKILVNEDKFFQVILNIIENSVSFSESNSTILIKSEKIDNKIAHLKIYDQGPGISIEYKDKIFDRFYSDRKEANNKYSGLGLSISKEIIKSFNGSIELTKSDERDFTGACFLIKLPLRP
tara:strand:- start:1149 stop:2879 length:1731 start_codon:yes stop_codon:yes gene_type:complete